MAAPLLFLALVAEVALLATWGRATRRAWALWSAAGGALGLALVGPSSTGFALPIVAISTVVPPAVAFGAFALPVAALLALGAQKAEAGRASPGGPALAAACVVAGFALVFLGDLAAKMADPCTRVVWAEGREALWVPPPPGCAKLTFLHVLPRPLGNLVAAATLALAAPLAARRPWAVGLVGWVLLVLGLHGLQLDTQGSPGLYGLQVESQRPLLGLPALVAAALCVWAAWRAQTIKGGRRIAAA